MARKCPNGNPDFYPMFDAIAGDHAPATRRHLYFGVCIPVRLLIFLVLLLFHRSRPLLALVALLSFIELVRKFPRSLTAQPQWWSVKIQVAVALVMMCVALGALVGKVNSMYVPIIWLASIVLGLLQNTIHPIC